MAINPIPVDQRVIDIDSRRFASIEKALVELITNSDDSYSRLERSGAQVTGAITVHYERHRGGALLVVADQAEGMTFDTACQVYYAALDRRLISAVTVIWQIVFFASVVNGDDVRMVKPPHRFRLFEESLSDGFLLGAFTFLQ